MSSNSGERSLLRGPKRLRACFQSSAGLHTLLSAESAELDRPEHPKRSVEASPVALPLLVLWLSVQVLEQLLLLVSSLRDCDSARLESLLYAQGPAGNTSSESILTSWQAGVRPRGLRAGFQC